jgi:hypothetical protein
VIIGNEEPITRKESVSHSKMKDITMTNATITSTATIATVATNNDINVDSRLNNIIAKHDAWNEGVRKASKQELYAVLAECFSLMIVVKVERGYAALNKKLDLLKVQYNSNTSLPTRIVRAVFKHDRRNLSRYAAIIKLAEIEKVTAETFIAWLTNLGGIDNARQHYAVPKVVAVSNDDLYKAATDHLRGASTLATVSGRQLANVSETPTSGYVVSIARVNAAGDYEIVGATSDTTALRKAMLSWGQHVIDTNKSIIAEDEAKTAINGLATIMSAQAA